MLCTKAIELLFKTPELSSHAIAAAAGCSHVTVCTLHRKLEDADIRKVDFPIGRDGKRRPARMPKYIAPAGQAA